MHTALRPYMTTGVALVGASVIAVTPISPPPAAIHMPAPRVSSASVELTAAFDPITAYTQLFTNTFNNLVGLGGEAPPAGLVADEMVVDPGAGPAQFQRLARRVHIRVFGAGDITQGSASRVQ